MFKPILPGPFNSDAFRDEVQKATQPVFKGIQGDFSSSYQTWSASSKPNQIASNKSVGNVLFSVQVIGEIYRLVWGGVKAHRIRARRARSLRFQSGYKAKTRPGIIPAGPGGPFGNVVHVMEVRHPGFPGRFQDKTIAKDWQQPYVELAQEGLNNGAKKSGHSI